MSASLYDDVFFKKRPSYRRRAPVMIRGVIDLYHPASYVDCGAALGDLVNEAITQGVDAIGLEGSPACLAYLQCPADRMLMLDLTTPLNLGRTYDVLTCFEVAEHIEEEHADTFIANLCWMSNRLIISICDYGPVTKIHPTIKPHAWWLEKFAAHRFTRFQDKEGLLRQSWETIRTWPAVKEAYRNLVILEKT